ncbi:ribosomal L1 domain-containing protein 1-like isoform X2 [Pecten maximus]|uniref:ribosomal L1 domain-containing protein 1-like isoform X2 n=1 Tax=Pecten maximus TaxID=6579 RepID=UPI001459074C|nr:ribosomal L1 domain-containing protein 1-like isoform X2 [Pecten maximus]
MKKERVSKSKGKKMQEKSLKYTKKSEDAGTDKREQEAHLEAVEKEKLQKSCLDVMKKEEVLKTLQLLLMSVKKDKKKSLLSDDKEEICLQFAVKKIPSVKNKIVKLRLPHSVWTPEQEVCLFVKDLDKSSREHEVTEQHYKDLLASIGISCITQVIPLKCLKLEYKPFEAKRNLSNMFDLFVADERVIRLLPSLLGKNFYGKKKHPIQVNMKATNLKSEIEKVVYDSRCIITGHGASSSATIGHSDMSAEQLAENVMKALESISVALPGGPANIQSVYVRTEKSLALPLYATFSSKKEVKFPKKPEKPSPVVGEISTLMNGHVLVTNMGQVKVGTLDDDGQFTGMRRKKIPKRTTKRKMDEESDDEMQFEQVEKKKRKTSFKKGKDSNKKSKTLDTKKTKDSVSSEVTSEVVTNVTSEVTPEMEKVKSSKAASKKGKKVLSKATPEKSKNLSSVTATNDSGKSLMKKSKIKKRKS